MRRIQSDPVAAGDINVALTILRIVRGWTQDDLARAAGVANSAISEYERGKKVPELSTLRRLVDAMGYPLSTLDRTRGFIASLQSDATLAALGAGIHGGSPRAVPARAQGRSDAAPPGTDRAAALQWEMEQVSAEAGRAVSRLTRLLLLLLSQETVVPTSATEADAEHGR